MQVNTLAEEGRSAAEGGLLAFEMRGCILGGIHGKFSVTSSTGFAQKCIGRDTIIVAI